MTQLMYNTRDCLRTHCERPLCWCVSITFFLIYLPQRLCDRNVWDIPNILMHRMHSLNFNKFNHRENNQQFGVSFYVTQNPLISIIYYITSRVNVTKNETVSIFFRNPMNYLSDYNLLDNWRSQPCNFM